MLKREIISAVLYKENKQVKYTVVYLESDGMLEVKLYKKTNKDVVDREVESYFNMQDALERIMKEQRRKLFNGWQLKENYWNNATNSELIRRGMYNFFKKVR